MICFALRLALFEGAVRTSPDKPENLGMGACLTLGLMGSHVIALAIGRFGFKQDLRTATMQALVCAFPDMAYFGAPILAAMFGPEGFLAVLIGNLVTSIFMLPPTIVLTRISDKGGAGHGWQHAWHVLSHSLLGAVTTPIVWLPVLGIALSLCHVTLPSPLLASVDTLGQGGRRDLAVR